MSVSQTTEIPTLAGQFISLDTVKSATDTKFRKTKVSGLSTVVTTISKETSIFSLKPFSPRFYIDHLHHWTGLVVRGKPRKTHDGGHERGKTQL